MLHDVVAASYQNDYRVEITFDDGACGIVDFSHYLERGGYSSDFTISTIFANSRSIQNSVR